MKITVKFEAQLRRAAGFATAVFDVGETPTAAQIVEHVGESAAEPLRRLLLDDAAAVWPTLMVFFEDEHVPLASTRTLNGEAVVTITSPISGG